MSLIAELKRRKVFKVGAAYLVVAWLLVQAASIGFPAFEAPPWALRVFILISFLGFPVALVMAWVLDLTREGVKLDASGAGRKPLFAVAAVLVALALVWFYRGQPSYRAGDIPAVADTPSVAVLPFGNATVIETLTGAQLETALLNGFSPVCNPNIATGRFPQVSGLVLQFHCNGTTPVVDGMFKAPDGPTGTLTAIGPTDTLRFVTNDFMYTGGDGYTIFFQGTDVEQTGDLRLDIAIDYVAANSPVDPLVEGRIVRN